MNIEEALTKIALDGGMDPDQLVAYAEEDKISGCEDGYYSPISISRNEGKILYAIIRYTAPNKIIEVGCHSGCSTTHMLSALERNGRGSVLSIDFDGMVDPGIPPELSHRWSQLKMDAREFEWPSGVDMLFEDGDHTRDLTEKMVTRAVEHGAKTVIAHDAYNESVGKEVVGGFLAATSRCYTILVDGPKLGFAYWFKDK